MNTFFRKIRLYVITHKILSAVVAIIVVYGGYKIYQAKHSTAGVTTYVLAAATNGSVESSVSGSGQVQSTNEINITGQVSGQITWVGVKLGDTVYAGQALGTIDDSQAKQVYADDQAALVQAKLQYEKDAAQAPLTYQNDQDALATAQQNLSNDYNSTFNSLSSSYLDFPTVMTDNDTIIFGYDMSPSRSQANVDVLTNIFQNIPDAYAAIKPFASSAQTDYNSALALYTPVISAFKQISRSSDPQTIETTLDQTVTMAKAVTQSVQSELNFLQEVTELASSDNIHLPSQVATLQSEAKTDLNNANSDLSSLLSMQNTLVQGKQTITNDQQNITLDQIGNPEGNNPISLQISSSSIAKQEQDLETERKNLAEYTITAPFAGTISAVNAKVGTNSSGTLFTMVANGKIAQISLNEVDAAKIALGEPVTLTFDAVSNLTIAGAVSEIDPVGTVSQGVVTYNVQIAFATDDPRVKPGMSVNANIITNVAENTLVVPNSAVHTDASGNSYVLVPAETVSPSEVGSSAVTLSAAPVEKQVQTGLASDTSTQIISGLSAGDIVISRTNTSAAASTNTSAPSLLGGARAGGGNATFIRSGGGTRVIGG